MERGYDAWEELDDCYIFYTPDGQSIIVPKE